MNWKFEMEMALSKKGDWFTSDLLRLIAKSDMYNREALRVAYPDHVAAFERFVKREGEFHDDGSPES